MVVVVFVVVVFPFVFRFVRSGVVVVVVAGGGGRGGVRRRSVVRAGAFVGGEGDDNRRWMNPGGCRDIGTKREQLKEVGGKGGGGGG